MSSSIMPDAGLVRSLLEHIDIDVQVDQILHMPEGTVNSTWQVTRGDDRLFVRLAPTDAEAEAGPTWMTSLGLRREQIVFGMLEGLDDLLPKTVHADWSRAIIDRDWIVQTAVRGDSWASLRAQLSRDETIDVWEQLAELTKQIHAVRGQAFGPPEDVVGMTTWSGVVRWDATGFLVDAQRFGLDEEPFRRLCELVDASQKDLDLIDTPRLVHSDLGQRHIFIRRDGLGRPRISGLIDMEFARFADPQSESVFVMQGLQPQPDVEFGVFLDVYGEDIEDRSFRLRALIYQLVALGWTVMDLHRRQRPPEIVDVMTEISSRLREAEGLV